MKEAWDSRKEVRDVMPFLQSHGVNTEHAWKIWPFYGAEKDVARRLRSLIGSKRSFGGIDVEKAVDRVRAGLSIAPAAGQLEALLCALENKVAVVTGGPGTGKTTLIKGLMEIFRRDRAEVALAAPTGRAAKRMSETTGHEAKTIHRLLEYNPGIGGFQRTERRPLDCDVVIIGEASMVDLLLMARLLAAVKQNARLILVGDVNQLPSVGAGNVLMDIIASTRVKVVSLTEVFRQASQSDIIVNAHRINQGIMPLWGADRGEGSDFFFIAQSDPSEVVRIIKELVGTRRALAAAMGNERIRKRYTMLDSRLRGRIEDFRGAGG